MTTAVSQSCRDEGFVLETSAKSLVFHPFLSYFRLFDIFFFSASSISPPGNPSSTPHRQHQSRQQGLQAKSLLSGAPLPPPHPHPVANVPPAHPHSTLGESRFCRTSGWGVGAASTRLALALAAMEHRENFWRALPDNQNLQIMGDFKR